MPQPRQSVECFVVVGASKGGCRYWVWYSDVDAAKQVKFLERANYTPEEKYTIRRANVAMLD